MVAGLVDASAPAIETPPMTGGECDPWRVELEAHFGASPLSGVAFMPDSATPDLGLLEFDRMMSLAPLGLSAAGTPAPVESMGACLSDEPWVWGDPDQPWRPCGTALPIRARQGDLRVEGGVGQVLLVVDGDVTLAAGARVFGMVVSNGVLALEGGARLEGLALAAAGLRVEAGSTVQGSACWATTVLSAQPFLRRLIPVANARIGPS
jgi:hypothetical protein